MHARESQVAPRLLLIASTCPPRFFGPASLPETSFDTLMCLREGGVLTRGGCAGEREGNDSGARGSAAPTSLVHLGCPAAKPLHQLVARLELHLRASRVEAGGCASPLRPAGEHRHAPCPPIAHAFPPLAPHLLGSLPVAIVDVALLHHAFLVARVLERVSVLALNLNLQPHPEGARGWHTSVGARGSSMHALVAAHTSSLRRLRPRAPASRRPSPPSSRPPPHRSRLPGEYLV